MDFAQHHQGSSHTLDSKGAAQVNHFSAMAERQLKMVFEENVEDKAAERELSERLNSKVKRISGRHSEKVTTQVRSNRYTHEFAKTIAKLSPDSMEIIFDSWIGFIIFVNAIFVGISMDAESTDSGGYLVIEIIFGVIFWFEMILKLRVHGWRRRYCCGIKEEPEDNIVINPNHPRSRVSCGECFSNCFDLSLVVIDTAQLIIQMGFKDLSE